MPRVKKINKELLEPQLRKEVEAIEADTSSYSALEGVANSEGGIILITALKRDIKANIDAIRGGYKTLSHIELVALVSKMDARIELLRSLTLAKKNYDLANDYLNTILGE